MEIHGWQSPATRLLFHSFSAINPEQHISFGIITLSLHKRYGVWNGRQVNCLFDDLLRRVTERTLKRLIISPFWPVDSPHKEPVMRKSSPCHDIIMSFCWLQGPGERHGGGYEEPEKVKILICNIFQCIFFGFKIRCDLLVRYENIYI